MPHQSLDSFYFWTSGSEAVEAAIKMARVITGRQNIICMQGGCQRAAVEFLVLIIHSGSFHGRTYGAMAVTKSKTLYSEGFLPLMVPLFA